MPIEYNPFDDEKLREIRADQTDPLVMYLIIRENLNMGIGKTAAQCAHAAQIILIRFYDQCAKATAGPSDRGVWEKLDLMKEWLGGSFRKVVLRADDKEWEKLKQELNCFIVRDAGLTEVEAGSETVIALWPLRKSACPKLIKKLQVLK